MPNVNFNATSTVTDPGHAHSVTAAYNGPSTSTASTYSAQSVPTTFNTNTATTGITVATTVASGGSSTPFSNLPPYYALCYIYKT